MRIGVAAGAVSLVLALFAAENSASAQPKPAAPKPAVTVKAVPKPAGKAASPKPAKSQTKAQPAKKGGKKPAARKNGDPSEPDEATRRVIAGLTAQKNARESAELTAMRQVDQALFPAVTPSAGEPWPVLGSPLVNSSEPKVSTSGLPPEGQLAAISPATPVKDLSWLKQLDMPDIPVRWDARVIRYLEFYKNDPRGRAMAATFIRKSGRYGGAIRRVLREQGLPEDILWLSLVESGFDPTIHSPAGAAGLWQFMPEGARIYGLYVDRWVDERHDPERSTVAAARYLSDLKTRFGSWELAFAAYNMGYGGLLAAIKKYNTNDFWELSKLEAGVPFETALYVPKIVSIAIVARNKATFGCDDIEVDPAITFDKISVESGVSLQSVASAAGVSLDMIESFNPQLLAGRTPPLAPGLTVDVKWTLRVPEGAGAKTAKALPRLIENEPKLERYTVRFGESIEDIASQRKTNKSSLAQLNGLKSGESVRPGTVIFVPAGPHGVAAALSAKPLIVVPAQTFVLPHKRRVFYRVVAGDTLAEVAAVLATTSEDLAKWNLLDSSAKLHDGMTLQAFVGEKQVLSGVVFLEEKDARILVVGSPDFFAHFEAQKGRDRVFVTVKEGDTWAGLAKRHGLSVGMIERINQRSRTSPLTPGERVVVYIPAGKAPAPDKADDKPEPALASAVTAPPAVDSKSEPTSDAASAAPEPDNKTPTPALPATANAP
ncbi:MAG: LysM peptidoglycan-binding domain-containing protein [Polyangiaceae bacterium]|nr:LysM peptidoglycan-binding domain-containing protein [Polyangiaceae bacterium]